MSNRSPGTAGGFRRSPNVQVVAVSFSRSGLLPPRTRASVRPVADDGSSNEAAMIRLLSVLSSRRFGARNAVPHEARDRKRVWKGKRVAERVDFGCRRLY